MSNLIKLADKKKTILSNKTFGKNNQTYDINLMLMNNLYPTSNVQNYNFF